MLHLFISSFSYQKMLLIKMKEIPFLKSFNFWKFLFIFLLIWFLFIRDEYKSKNWEKSGKSRGILSNHWKNLKLITELKKFCFWLKLSLYQMKLSLLSNYARLAEKFHYFWKIRWNFAKLDDIKSHLDLAWN